jgi:hypothetical protein
VLWIAHTQALAASDVTPSVNVHLAEMRSGKPAHRESLGLLMPRSWRRGAGGHGRRQGAQGSGA